MHTIQNCMSFWELVTPEAGCWLALLRKLGVGFGLVGASTQVLGLLEFTASSLYKELPVPCGPWHEVLQPAPLIGLLDKSSA